MENKESNYGDKPNSNEELAKVILHNDDETTMEFVVFVLESIFDKSREEAKRITMEIHTDGQGVAGSYSPRIAQAKTSAVRKLARAEGFPLRCTADNQDNEGRPTRRKKNKPPTGWLVFGGYPEDYEVAIDTTVFHSGHRSALIRNSVEAPRGTSTLMQQFSPDEYLDKRLRMKVWVKSDQLEMRAQPWLRIDGHKTYKSLAFDNSCNRPIEGTTDWQEYALVLDVPQESTNIAFGVMLTGAGTVWIDDITFEEVGSEVSTSDCPCDRRIRAKVDVRNLNFEED